MYPISRLRVAINKMIVPLLNFPKPFSFVGPGSSLTLCRFIAESGAKRVMVITDGPLFKLGLVSPIVDALQKAGVTTEVYSEVRPDPTYDQVLDGIEKLKAFEADAVLAVGGGSPIDCAKTMLMCLANNAHPSKLLGLWLYALPRKPCMPFYAIPTTAGTGSEVTITAVVTDPQARSKAPIIDPKMVPIMMALDAQLTLGLPAAITAPTGMDALTHAVEAYLSTMSTTETSELALSATSAIMRNLSKVYADGSDFQAREDMLVGSCLAGMAFTRVGLGYVHAFAHQMGGLYHVPHGFANAIILPYVLDFSKGSCAPRLAQLARVSGLSGTTDAELADAFIAKVRELGASMQIPRFIKELKREDFDAIVTRAFSEAHGTYGLPRYMKRADAVELLEKLLPR